MDDAAPAAAGAAVGAATDAAVALCTRVGYRDSIDLLGLTLTTMLCALQVASPWWHGRL
jgi:hypothetical protein